MAALLADLEPGARVFACFTVKSKDEQTAMLRLSEMAATRDELPAKDEYSEDEDEEEDEEESTPEKNNPPMPKEKSQAERMVEHMGGGDSTY